MVGGKQRPTALNEAMGKAGTARENAPASNESGAPCHLGFPDPNLRLLAQLQSSGRFVGACGEFLSESFSGQGLPSENSTAS
jgi:hypothetical protein